jgi:colanic acid/amylovoran biosynthesis protein
MAVFVGTRMHSNIFALSQYVPAMAISYLPKTTYIMESLELSDYVVDITIVNTSHLCKLFDLLWEHRSALKGHLEEKIPTVQQRIAGVLDVVFSSTEQSI